MIPNQTNLILVFVCLLFCNVIMSDGPVYAISKERMRTCHKIHFMYMRMSEHVSLFSPMFSPLHSITNKQYEKHLYKKNLVISENTGNISIINKGRPLHTI